MKVKAVFINKPGEVETRWVDYPHKKENEVLIKVDAAGICGSDIGAFRGTNPLVTYPRIIGHEVTGIVLQEGAGMPDNIKKGDRVIVDPYIYCGHCYPCSVGRTNVCYRAQRRYTQKRLFHVCLRCALRRTARRRLYCCFLKRSQICRPHNKSWREKRSVAR